MVNVRGSAKLGVLGGMWVSRKHIHFCDKELSTPL